MSDEVLQSEIKAISIAVRCLAASLKQSGALDEELYVARLASTIGSDYKQAQNKEVFDLFLQNFIDDIKRSGNSAS
ncbi:MULTISPECIES: hypothetical protein [Pseudomonas]|jgi:hypothetical protein|uniref:hypothetical protein n=1 Tax=Pseudomonas TaxID=286 RepID=UPI00049034FC|nr:MULTISPECIES: hypothetical protein [Pseudomonas putida group]